MPKITHEAGFATRKSSHSNPSGNCVKVGASETTETAGTTAFGDTTLPAGSPMVVVPSSAARAFIGHVRATF